MMLSAVVAATLTAGLPEYGSCDPAAVDEHDMCNLDEGADGHEAVPRVRRNDTRLICTTETTVEERDGTIIITDREQCRPMGGGGSGHPGAGPGPGGGAGGPAGGPDGDIPCAGAGVLASRSVLPASWTIILKYR